MMVLNLATPQDREGGGDSQWGECGGGGAGGELELLHSHSASVYTQLWGGLRQVWGVGEIVVMEEPRVLVLVLGTSAAIDWPGFLNIFNGRQENRKR